LTLAGVVIKLSWRVSAKLLQVFEVRTLKKACGFMPNAKPSAGEPIADSAFELVALIKRCLGDRPLAAALIEKFTSRLPNTIEQIECSLTAKDWPVATSKVHNLKGEAGNLAAHQVHASATSLEDCLRAGSYSDARAHFLRLRTAAMACVETCASALDHLA
jgi:HPt (histidine-containing phosphotransfer) domain-containing protein